MNYKLEKPLYQHFSTNNFNIQFATDIISYLDPVVESLSHARRSVFNFLIRLHNNYDFIYPSQTFVASQLGLSRRHVNTVIQDLVEFGFIKSIYRHRYSSVYKINPLFDNLEIREKLSSIFNSLKQFPLKLLFAATGAVNSQKFSPIRNSYSSSYVLYKNKLPFSLKLEIKSNLKFVRGQSLQKKAIGDVTSREGLFKKRKEVRRFVYKPGCESVIPDYIREFKELPLTKWGQVKLCAFPKEAIVYARDCYKRSKGAIKDRFGWVYSILHRYCKEQNIAPDYSGAFGLAIKLQMPDNANMLLKGIQEAEKVQEQPKSLYPTYVSQSRTSLWEEDIQHVAETARELLLRARTKNDFFALQALKIALIAHPALITHMLDFEVEYLKKEGLIPPTTQDDLHVIENGVNSNQDELYEKESGKLI